MNPIPVLFLGAVGTYALRLLFITLIPANRLPERLRGTLQLVGPAALAALISSDITHATEHPTNIWSTMTAVAGAGVISAVTKNLGATILGGLSVGLIASLIL